MTLTRIGATHLLEQASGLLTGRVLEIGSGPDHYSDLLFGSASRRITVDIAVSHHPTVVADAHALPFDDRVFDSSLASQVLEHLAEPGTALRELHRVLRPGGAVVMAVPFLYPLHELPHDYHRFTEYALNHMLKRAGFERISIRGYGGRIAVTLDILTSPAARPSLIRKVMTAVWRRLVRPLAMSYSSISSAALALALREPGRHPAGYVVTAHRPTGV